MFTPTLRCECAQPGLIDTMRKWSITKPEKTQICYLYLNHSFLEGPFFKTNQQTCSTRTRTHTRTRTRVRNCVPIPVPVPMVSNPYPYPYPWLADMSDPYPYPYPWSRTRTRTHTHGFVPVPVPIPIVKLYPYPKPHSQYNLNEQEDNYYAFLVLHTQFLIVLYMLCGKGGWKIRNWNMTKFPNTHFLPNFY